MYAGLPLLQRLGLAAAVAVIPASSLAQPAQPAQRDAVTAEALFNTGKRLLAGGDWKAACAKFEASMELDPAVGTLIKIARCREHEGKLAQAWYDYQRATQLNRQKTDQPERRRAELEEHIALAIAALDPRVPRLKIVVAPAATSVRVIRDGIELPRAALGEPLPVDPGKHEIGVEATGFRPEKRVVEAAEGKTEVVKIDLVAESPPPILAPAPVAPTATAAPQRSAGGPAAQPAAPADGGVGRTRRTIGLALAGGGIVTLGVASYFGVKTLSKVSDSTKHCTGSVCNQEGVDLRDDARTTQAVGFVLLGVGAAALGAGVALYATAPSPPPRVGGRTVAAGWVHVGPGGGAVGARW